MQDALALRRRRPGAPHQLALLADSPQRGECSEKRTVGPIAQPDTLAGEPIGGADWWGVPLPVAEATSGNRLAVLGGKSSLKLARSWSGTFD